MKKNKLTIILINKFQGCLKGVKILKNYQKKLQEIKRIIINKLKNLLINNPEYFNQKK